MMSRALSRLTLALLLISIQAVAHEAREIKHIACEARLLGPLAQLRLRAGNQLSRIQLAANGAEKTQVAYYSQIAAAAEAATGKHDSIFQKKKGDPRLDLARHRVILESIAEFDDRRPFLSIYRIKRAIEGRHSLREYIDCKSSD